MLSNLSCLFSYHVWLIVLQVGRHTIDKKLIPYQAAKRFKFGIQEKGEVGGGIKER